MPTVTLREQVDNSCAAHCTVIAVAELTGAGGGLTADFAEATLWPAIQFVADGNGLVDMLAAKKNSDPWRIIEQVGTRWGGQVAAKLICDETEKSVALHYVGTDMQMGLGALFNMIKRDTSVADMEVAEGVYYNASFLMFGGATPTASGYSGMHNILITRSGGRIFRYNPNESVPAWIQGPVNWTYLENQNGGAHSYVFTGVCVEMTRK